MPDEIEDSYQVMARAENDWSTTGGNEIMPLDPNDPQDSPDFRRTLADIIKGD